MDDNTHVSEDVVKSIEDKPQIPELLKDETESEVSSAVRAAGATADGVSLGSGCENSEQCSKEESESITNKVEENKQILISEPIPSDGGGSKYERLAPALSPETQAIQMEIDESVSFPASEGLFSLNSPTLSSPPKENSSASDDVKNYEVEDDLKLLEAFIAESATNPEITVCAAKQSENATKYSLESSLLDDLRKSDEVESLHATINEEIADPRITTHSTIKNTPGPNNSKSRFSEGLERLSPEITPALEYSPAYEANNASTQPKEPKSIDVGKVLRLQQSVPPMKITDFAGKREDILPNFTMKNVSKGLTPGMVTRYRGRPPGSGKKLNLETKLTGKLQRIKRCSENNNLEKNSVEVEKYIVNGITKDSGLKSPENPQVPIDSTEDFESSQRVRFNTRKIRNVEIGGALEKFAKRDELNESQVSSVSTNMNVSEFEKTCKKPSLSRINYPVCMSLLTYSQLKSNAKEIALPSPLWSVQIDATRDCIAFLAAAIDIPESKLILEKAIIFEKSLKPVILLKNELINVPYSSLDNFEDVVLLIENVNNIQICEGTSIKQRPYSKFCYKFVDVANSGQRCSQCIEERRRVLFCYTRKLREKVKLLEKS